jgi:small GTP-binding protein
LAKPKILFEVEDDLNTSAIAVGDATGSGLSELCTGGRDGILRLYDANQAEINLLAQRSLEGSILSIKIEDANNDGQMEIVVGRSLGSDETPGVSGTLQIYRYAMSGQLQLLAEHPVDRFVTTVQVTDVTGDGKNEILAGGSDSTLRIFKMDTQNNLTEFIQHKLQDMPITIGICDTIGDEIEEIVTGNRDKTLRVFKVKNSSVEEVQVIELPSPVISIGSGDILGDRKSELAAVTNDGSVRIYRNEESKLDLFTKIEGIHAQFVRMAEVNADHMDEIIVATSDHKVIYYNMYMADLKELAIVDIGSKILSISIGDAGGDDRKEVLVGVSGGALKVVQGLYHIIPKFEVSQETQTGANLKGCLTLRNVTTEPVTGITGKIYWFPKEHMDVSPDQLKFDLGANEQKAIDIQLKPKEEGTVIIRPIVMMWQDFDGNVKQVTTPETAVLVQEGVSTAAPAAVAPVSFRDDVQEEASDSLFAPVKEEASQAAETTYTPSDPITGPDVVSAPTDDGTAETLREAEKLLDDLFGSSEIISHHTLPEEETIVEPPSPPPAALESTTEVSTETVPVTPPSGESVESAKVAEIRSRPQKPRRADLSEDAYMFLFKCMITGEGAVGKTTLVNRYVTGTFERDYKTTIGSQFAVKLAHISPDDQDHSVGIKLQVWDVAGQARFQAVRKMYYSGAAGVVLVFDVTRRRSFAELVKWVEEADESIGHRVPIIVVGNKTDLPDRAVPAEEARNWAEGNGFLYMESSAKTGEGVADMFTVLSDLMYTEAREAMIKKRGGV